MDLSQGDVRGTEPSNENAPHRVIVRHGASHGAHFRDQCAPPKGPSGASQYKRALRTLSHHKLRRALGPLTGTCGDIPTGADSALVVDATLRRGRGLQHIGRTGTIRKLAHSLCAATCLGLSGISCRLRDGANQWSQPAN